MIAGTALALAPPGIGKAAQPQSGSAASAATGQERTSVAETVAAPDRAAKARKPGRSMTAVPAGDPAQWFSPDNYPAEALRAGRQGRVAVEIGVDSAGGVASCTVATSSGTTLLDEGTCAVVRDHGRFDPATDARGRPIAGRVRIGVRWQLPEGPPARDAADLPAHDGYAVAFYFSADGVLASCQVLERAKETKFDPCREAKIGEQGSVVERDGKRTRYRIVWRMSQDVVIGDDG